jgi:hypothetical protein
MGYRLDGQGLLPGRGMIFHYSPAFILALGPTQPPVQWVLGALSSGVMWVGYEADYSPSSAEIKNGGAISPLPHTSL